MVHLDVRAARGIGGALLWEPGALARYGRWPLFLGPLLAAIAYYAGAQAAFSIGTLTHQFAPFWPPNVVLFCVFLLTPPQLWPAYILAAFPAHELAECGVAMPLLQLVAAFASNVAVALLSAVVLRGLLHGRAWLSSLRGAALYLLVAVFAVPVLVALFAALEPWLGGAEPGGYWQYWWRWYLSNALGNLTLMPRFLTWLWDGLRFPLPRPSRKRLIEGALIALGLMASCIVAFNERLLWQTPFLFPAVLYLPVPLLLVAAARFGGKGASGAVFVLTVTILFRAMHGEAALGGSVPGFNVTAVQLFLATMAIPAILIAALVDELRRALAERRTAQHSAQATGELLQSSLDALTAQIAILDSNGNIVAANAAWDEAAELISASGEQYHVGANYLRECGRNRPHRRVLAEGIRKLLDGQIVEFRGEYRSDFLTGHFFQMRATCFGSAEDRRVVIAHEDITEVKTSEGALRSLTGKLLRSQDEARRRIARDLHDSTAQNLLAAELGISQAQRLAPRLNRLAAAALDESRALIDQAQQEIRTVAYLLHPPMLDEAGLPSALRWLCGGFSSRTNIHVELDIAEDIKRLPSDTEAALFRIAQEGLSNVRRHSGSTAVRVGLQRDGAIPPVVTLAIEDDGTGMPAQIARSATSPEAQPTLGIGLAGMRERLHQLGGHLEIETGPGGTSVRALVPLPTESAAPDCPARGDGPILSAVAE